MNLSKEATDMGEDTSGICPVTGLPITSKPEWTDIDLGEGYSVTFRFIGDRILLSVPRGKSGKHGMENLMRERAGVLDAILGPEESFFEIKDYSGVEARVTKAGRDQFVKGMRAYQDRIIGFIGYNAPLAVRLAVNVGAKLHKAPFPVLIFKNYERSIKAAARALEGYGPEKEASFPRVITSDDWSLQFDGYSVRYEIIDGDVFHAVPKGFLEEEFIDPIFEVYENAITSIDHPEGTYYFIAGMTESGGGSRKARKLYYERIKELYENYPFRMYIFYGVNSFLRAAINLTSSVRS